LTVFIVMVKPLSLGEHKIGFGGTIPTNPFPLLSDFSSGVTCHVNVVAPSRPAAAPTPFAQQTIDRSERIAEMSVEPSVLN
jgi:hypothetical protein